MKKKFVIFMVAAMTLSFLALTACPTNYIIASPISVTQTEELTKNRDSTIKDSSGANVPAKYVATFDVETLAKAQYVDPTKINKIKFDYVLSDDNWWFQYTGFNYQIGSGSVSAISALGSEGGRSFHGSTTGSAEIPYTGSGDLKIILGSGDGTDNPCVDLKISNMKFYFN